MKLLKVFALFIALHVTAWGASHWYLSQNKSDILLVVDTSYSMKPKFSEMEKWIANYDSNARYRTITVGTDKAELGNIDELKSYASIFRTAFGRMSEASLQRYTATKAKEKILLSDGLIQPEGWKVISF